MKHLKKYETICHSIEDLNLLTKREKKIYSSYKFKMGDYVKYIGSGRDKYFLQNNYYKIGSVDILENYENDSIYALCRTDGHNEFVRWVHEYTMISSFIKVDELDVHASKYNL